MATSMSSGAWLRPLNQEVLDAADDEQLRRRRAKSPGSAAKALRVTPPRVTILAPNVRFLPRVFIAMAGRNVATLPSLTDPCGHSLHVSGSTCPH